MHIKEVGKTYSNKNFKHLITAYQQLKAALGQLLADDAIDGTASEDDKDDDANEKPVKEASTWSLADRASALGRDLSELHQNAYILDIFPEENKIVYQVGWRGSYFERPYTMDESGVATFGDPIEVTRKVSYVPTSDQQAAPVSESAEIELTTSEIALIEKAVDQSGTVMLKLISPGVGSSGYYSEAVLKRDGPKVFTKGLHNLIDHPTAQEEKDRPEGSITNLGSTLTEDARWYDDYKGNGAGLYAPAKVVPTFRETLNTIASDIGTSIRAKGKARKGLIDGKEMPIIESIDRAISVDYVTLPGRGGKVIELMESARNKGDHEMTVDQVQFDQLQEANRKLTDQIARLNEAQARVSASAVVASVLQTYPTLPKPAKVRIATLFETSTLPFADNGALDKAALTEQIKNAVAIETAFLAELGIGRVQNLGASAPASDESDPEKLYEAYLADIKDL